MSDFITDNLDLWSSVVVNKSTVGRSRNGKQEAYGINKLRELILELAVLGRLVPQNPNDESVNVLLGTMEEEKARLIKEGEIKNQKTLVEITEIDELFVLPEGWVWRRLGDLGNIYNGNSISARVKEAKYTGLNYGLPFIATKDIGYGWQELDYKNGISIPLDETSFKVAHKRAVLICAEGGSAGKKCGITNQDICFGNKLFAVELYAEFEPNYLLSTYLSPTFYTQFSGKMTGIIGGISLAKFKELLIPIPPLEEQRRIVAKVGELMAMCDQLELQQTDSLEFHKVMVETLLALPKNVNSPGEFAESWNRIANHFETLLTTEHSIDQLKQTILQLIVTGKLIKFDSKTERRVVKDLLSFGPRNGFSPRESSYETKVKVLKLGATTKGHLDLEESKYVDIVPDVSSHLWIRDNDILIQRGNAAQYVGCNVVVSGNPVNTIYPDLMMKLQVNDRVLPKYLSLHLSSQLSRQYMWERMTGTSGTMPKISKKIVESIPIFLPNIETQKQLLLLYSRIENLLDTLSARLKQVQTTQVQLADAIVEQAVA